MTLSIRNRLNGTVIDVAAGEAMAAVKVRLDGGQVVTAAVTADAVEELNLAKGSPVRALIKSTEVSLATEPVTGLSIRNQLPGTVTDVALGQAMARVNVDAEGSRLTAAITRDSAVELGLSPGSSVTVLIKSTEVALDTV
ncbi:TOBE domain-containing protein [Streptomyces sp. HNM0575]|uniref:TOBE domain-containing protein n=1 Tax=Streptomyces sp. HNM0575 TaxID=2716338 RepID=UPI00145ED996|nr:TOBE domain-containing protein [Streptomyces sp. HNM0575]NLU75670.1 TOBE domain-containing protein [Streptomyces sp. HNM0575]